MHTTYTKGELGFGTKVEKRSRNNHFSLLFYFEINIIVFFISKLVGFNTCLLISIC